LYLSYFYDYYTNTYYLCIYHIKKGITMKPLYFSPELKIYHYKKPNCYLTKIAVVLLISAVIILGATL